MPISKTFGKYRVKTPLTRINRLAKMTSYFHMVGDPPWTD